MATLKGGRQAFYEFLPALPDDYRSAVSALREAIWTWELPFIFLGTIGEAIASTALATDILCDLRDPKDFLAIDLDMYLAAEVGRSPDARLDLILSALLEAPAGRDIQDSITQCVRQFAPSMDQEAVNAAYLELPLGDRKHIGDQIHNATISIVKNLVPFTVVDESAVHSLNGELWDSWAVVLPNMAPRQESPTPRPLEVVDAHVRYVLDRLEYEPAKRFKHGVWFYPFEHRAHIFASALAMQAKLYVGVLHFPTAHAVEHPPHNPLMPPAHGATVFMHAVVERNDTYEYSCPLPRGALETETAIADSRAPCALTCQNGDELSRFLRDLEAVDHVRTIGQWPRDTWSSIGFPQDAVSTCCRPLVVIAASSTLEHWERTLHEYAEDVQLWVWHGQERPSAGHAHSHLVVGDDAGSIVWARPTSSTILAWLQRNVTQLPSIRIVDDLPGDERWHKRLDIACHHYLAEGW